MRSLKLGQSVVPGVILFNAGLATCVLFGIRVPWILETPSTFAITFFSSFPLSLLILHYGMADSPRADLTKLGLSAFYFVLLLVAPRTLFGGWTDDRFYLMVVGISGMSVIVLSCRVFSTWPGLLIMCGVPTLTLLAKSFLYQGTLGNEPTVIAVILFTAIPFVLLWYWFGGD